LETGNIILEDLFSSVLSQFKKHHPSRNLKFNNLGIFQSLKLRNFVERNPSNFSSAEFHSKYYGLFWINASMHELHKFQIFFLLFISFSIFIFLTPLFYK